MRTKELKMKSQQKILTCKILCAALFVNFGVISLAPAANAEYYPVISSGNCWEWEFGKSNSYFPNSISEMNIYPNTNCGGEDLLGDLYDGFGLGSVNGDTFNWSLSESFNEGELNGNEIVIPGSEEEENADSAYTITFSKNNVTYEIISTSGEDNLRIWGNLGSDTFTRFITLGGRLFSYQVQNRDDYLWEEKLFAQNIMPSYDPILLWETSANASVVSINRDPTTGETIGFLDSLVDSNDDVNVSFTGNMLRLKHYAFAYQINGASYQTNNPNNDRINNQKNTERFFTQFLAFVDADQTRTDIFTYYFSNLVPSPTPALRQTSNLSFEQSQYGSDTLSDPDGQLRKTIDSINAKYGNLIK